MKQKVREYTEYKLRRPGKFPEFRSSLSPQMIAFLKKIDGEVSLTERVLKFVVSENRMCCDGERKVTGEKQLYNHMLEFLNNAFAAKNVKEIETFCKKHKLMLCPKIYACVCTMTSLRSLYIRIYVSLPRQT